MKKLILGMFAMFAVMAAAENVKGIVKDTQGQPMAYVTISVLAPDSTLITGCITDEQGQYEVPVADAKPGQYIRSEEHTSELQSR